MDTYTRNQIKSLVSEKIEEKLNKYRSESEYKPFFNAIFGPYTVVQASIMQSLYTSFGMSIYEQLAVLLAKARGYEAKRQYRLPGYIDTITETLITDICKSKDKPDKQRDLSKVRGSILPTTLQSYDPECVVDVFVKMPNGRELYVDITTVKPNLKEFRTLRKKMLRWAALRYSTNPNALIETYIGIPYNPYYPEPYTRWTGNDCDPKEILVQNDLWSVFAGYNVYPELITIFEEVGNELRPKVDRFLSNN